MEHKSAPILCQIRSKFHAILSIPISSAPQVEAQTRPKWESEYPKNIWVYVGNPYPPIYPTLRVSCLTFGRSGMY